MTHPLRTIVGMVGATPSDPAAESVFRPGLLRRTVAPVARTVWPRVVGAHQRARASQFAVLGPPPAHVVMFGDSITEGGLWEEWLPGQPVLNRGIGGETTADLLRRVDTAVDGQRAGSDPVAVFLLVGTNDLMLGVPLRTVVDNVEQILAEVNRRVPGTPVVVQSVMPRSVRYRDDLRSLNTAYRALVDRSGEHVTYLDLWPALATIDGALRPTFTTDGLHLTGDGYAAWVTVLRPHVDRLLAPSRD